MGRSLRVVARAVAIGIMGAGAASASPIGLMFESVVEEPDGSELAFNTYSTLADLLAGSNSTSQFSQINVSSPFSTTGITWDGSQFLVMFESDVDEPDGSELAFNTYSTLADLLAGSNSTSQFSQIDVSSPFSTTGLWTVPMQGGGGGTVVPLPASVWLLASALLSAGAAGRKRRARSV